MLTKAKASPSQENPDKTFALPDRPVQAIDTTGAGDTFLDVLLAHLARGNDVEVALSAGRAASALAVTRFGAASSIPTKKRSTIGW
jgi:ribokinase